MVITHFLRRYAARLRNQFCDRESTQPTLARTHAAAKKSLHLIRARTAQRDRIEDLLRRHFFATTHNRVTLWLTERLRRPEELIKKAATA